MYTETAICPACGATIEIEEKYCQQCGAERAKLAVNICQNQDCIRHRSKYNYPEKAKYCGFCGKLTTYGTNLKEFL